MLFDEKKFRASLPAEMLSEKRFVRYFLKAKPEGGTAKIPLGSHSDPNTWSTFDECVSKIENENQGVGYCFLGGDIHGLDIDHCRNPRSGQLCNEAMLLLSRLPSWAEFSVSGQGIHVFFKGHVRGKQLSETCIQYWNPKSAPRFFALTCETVGEAFSTLKDIGNDFNYIFATARHISAKIREELKGVDYEQWASLPAEREHKETVEREKSKTKTRKLHKDFKLESFLSFYNLQVDNITTNTIGTCYRLRTCPIKGEAHVGQNSTTTNFILGTDGGLGFHCQSTGCVEYSVADVIEKLAKDTGPYPDPIYEAKKQQTGERIGGYEDASLIAMEHRHWLWPGFLGRNKPAMFGGASAEGKSPVTLNLAACVSSGSAWPDGAVNELGPKNVFILAAEDDWSDTVIPRLKLAGADLTHIKRFFIKQDGVELTPALDSDCLRLEKAIQDVGDVALIIIDPITNYLGTKKMNAEEEIRSGILMPLSGLASRNNCCVIVVGHLNKRGNEAALLQRLLGAAAFGGVMRDVFLFGNDPEDEDKYAHLMAEIRNKSAPILKYKTEQSSMTWDGQTSEVVGIKWCGVSKANIDEIVNAPKQAEKSKTGQIAAFILGMLRDGAKSKVFIDQAISEQGFDLKAVNWDNVKKKTGAKSRKITGQGKSSGWEWFLPTPEQAEFDK